MDGRMRAPSEHLGACKVESETENDKNFSKI